MKRMEEGDCVHIEPGNLLRYLIQSEETSLAVVSNEGILRAEKKKRTKQGHKETECKKEPRNQFHVATTEIAGKHRQDWSKKGTL